MKEFKHPNLMSLLASYETEHFFFIVMEQAIGGDVIELFNKNNSNYQYLDESFACKVIYQVGKGLEHMHKQGVWHRDIKPDNILILNDDLNNPQVALTDFGFSKQFEPGETTKEILGTPLYKAPEINGKNLCMYTYFQILL